MNGCVHSNFFAFAEKDFGVSCCQTMQFVSVERTHIPAMIPDGTYTLHQGLQPGPQGRGALTGFFQLGLCQRPRQFTGYHSYLKALSRLVASAGDNIFELLSHIAGEHAVVSACGKDVLQALQSVRRVRLGI